ncbi:glycosyltransferase family 2 protein [bacterium]|nr:glycosyltransferase family 2 protein [bacterium]
MKRPKFSIIAVDYEFHVPRDGMRKGLASLSQQTFKDYELIICHDGPKSIAYEQEIDFKAMGLDPIITNTEEWKGDWGHWSRDKAMRMAKGQYFFQFNIDNYMYPNCLQEISDHIDRTKALITIFHIKHFKTPWFPHATERFTGMPPIEKYIDAMQLVAHRRVWEEMGYWYDKGFCGDGAIYEAMCRKYPWTELPEILGENY